jgi:hypothetical protein
MHTGSVIILAVIALIGQLGGVATLVTVARGEFASMRAPVVPVLDGGGAADPVLPPPARGWTAVTAAAKAWQGVVLYVIGLAASFCATILAVS